MLNIMTKNLGIILVFLKKKTFELIWTNLFSCISAETLKNPTILKIEAHKIISLFGLVEPLFSTIIFNLINEFVSCEWENYE